MKTENYIKQWRNCITVSLDTASNFAFIKLLIMKTLDLKINGMGSAHCVGVVKNIVNKQDGATIENIEIGKAQVNYDPDKVSPQTIVQKIEKSCAKHILL